MIEHIPFASLGRADYGWLQARYHFSFGQYHNPARTRFGTLRVVNDDIVAPGTGFDPHPHRDMEIITYVRHGAVTHKDSAGGEGTVHAGDVQVMSAGTGVTHSEYNLGDVPLRLYQIWIMPDQAGGAPRHETRVFPKTPAAETLPCLASGYEEDIKRGAAMIRAKAALYGGTVPAGGRITVRTRGGAYILASDGAFSVSTEGEEVGELRLAPGDGAAARGKELTLQFKAETQSEILVIDVPGA